MSQNNSTPADLLQIDVESGEAADDASILPLQHGAFPVVGIGGSAGSIPALQSFFKAVPANPGMAFVVILHLSPDYESNLAHILGGATAMPVTQVTQTTPIEVNHVYVIPPSHLLSMHDGHIELVQLQRESGRRVAVDLFFRALAESTGARAICLVLSGTDSDGSIGLKRVKERGGLTMAQQPEDAQYDEMPRNAIDTGMVDWVLPVAEMPARLMRMLDKESEIRLPSIEPPTRQQQREHSEAEAEDALREILVFLAQTSGHDFSHYKRATVLRRIARRLQVNGLADLPTYVDFLRSHAGESGALLQDLLISVTNFFRDAPAFDALEVALPGLLRDKGEGDQIRAWVPGCATGEEAYSLAILLSEYLSRIQDWPLETMPSVQIFATDIDRHAISAAREGLYPTSIAADVSNERLRRFFTSEQGRFRVKKELRETVLFAEHNLLKDSPFSSLDLVTCRNLLIYFGAEAQNRVFETFHFALRPAGILMLGSSETVGDSSLFAPIDKKQRLYERRPSARPIMALPIAPLPSLVRVPLSPIVPLAPNGASALPEPKRDFASFGELHLQLLEEYAPPSVLVNEDYDIVHLSDGAGRFLQWGGGEVSINLLRVVPPTLRLELQTALFQALQSGERVEVGDVPAQYEGQTRAVKIVVRPLRRADGGPYALVIFDLQTESGPLPAPSDEPVANRLEAELRHVRVQLKNTAQQYEASTEELKASNEELQAMNEELRSATEELETGKEELQSVNEELITVNAELKHKVEEVSYANSNLNNLMASTDIATIFMDREGHIKRYTPRAVDLFNLIPTDVGRPLADLRHKFSHEAWAKDAQQTLADLAVIDREVRTTEGGWYLSRMLPYRTVEDRIDGVVLTFMDITARKKAEETSRASEERFRLLVAGVRDYAIFLLDETGIITSWNGGVERVFGYSERDWIGRQWDIVVPEADRAGAAQLLQQVRESGEASQERWDVRKDGTHFWASSTLNALHDGNGELRGFVNIVRDVSERRRAEDELRAANEELETRVAQRTAELERLNGALKAENLDWRESEGGRIVVVRQLEDELTGLKQLLQGIPAGVIIAHDDGRPLFLNTRARQNLSMPDGIEFDEEVQAWLHAPGAPLERALAGENVASEEHDFTREGDNAVSLSVSAEPIPNGEGKISAVIVAFQDITERKRAEVARQHLLQRVVNAQEEERQRISRELHDQMGQQLTALLMVLDSMLDAPKSKDNADDKASDERLQKLKMLVEELMDQAHHLAWELRPAALDNIGLRAALEQYLANWGQSTGVKADFAARGLGAERLSKTVEITLYRVIQEALTNVQRHAGASLVSVLLEKMDGDVSAIVEDNGNGFDAEAGAANDTARLGLVGMRERIELVGGNLTIESSVGQGTTVYARVPIGARRERSVP